jgi:glucose-6-phosphate-specific signal transduction histidine kinase
MVVLTEATDHPVHAEATVRGYERSARCDLVAAVRIHDEVVPRLCAVARVLATGGDAASEFCVRLHDELNAALRELREALLTPVTSDAPSLRAAVRDWQEQGVPVQVDYLDAAEVPAEAQRLVLDVVAEAVRNAIDHGAPGTIEISVAELDGRLHVSTSSGLAATSDGHGGLGVGLRLAAAAAARHGGGLDWGPVGDRWLVRLTIPLAGR